VLYSPDRKTRALTLGVQIAQQTCWPFVDGLDAGQPEIPSHAIGITFRDAIVAHNLSLNHTALASPGAGEAGSDEDTCTEFLKYVEHGPTVVPGWTPAFFSHTMEFDLNGAWGPSAPHC
jgi:hypothetical protein